MCVYRSQQNTDETGTQVRDFLQTLRASLRFQHLIIAPDIVISTSWGSHLILTQEVLDNLEEGVVYGIHGEKLGDNPHCDPFAGQWKGQCQDRVIFLVFLFEIMLKVVHAMLVFLGSCSNDSDVSAIYLEIVAVAACILASTIVFYADFVGAEAGKAVVFVGIGAVCVRVWCRHIHSFKKKITQTHDTLEHRYNWSLLCCSDITISYEDFEILCHYVNSSTSRSHSLSI